jgi:hypothetical protein
MKRFNPLFKIFLMKVFILLKFKQTVYKEFPILQLPNSFKQITVFFSCSEILHFRLETTQVVCLKS